MPLENLTGNKYIDALNASWPDGAIDTPDAGDDHLRGIKNVLKKTFPNMNGPVTRSLESINRGVIPIGNTTIFYQATAPVGWTRAAATVTAMLRVIPTEGFTGGISGGTDDPILNNKVPSHNHTYSGVSFGASADHVHSFNVNSGGNSVGHNHGAGSLSTQSAGGHNHSYEIRTSTSSAAAGSASAGLWAGSGSGGTGVNGEHSHSISGATANESAVHIHNVSGTTSGHSQQHAHGYSGTTANNPSASNWTPRYLNVILCTRTS